MEEKTREGLIRCVKRTFTSEDGLRTLEYLRLFCRANHSQSCFDSVSATQTAYNLGANAVYRNLMSMVEYDFSKEGNSSCVMGRVVGDEQ